MHRQIMTAQDFYKKPATLLLITSLLFMLGVIIMAGSAEPLPAVPAVATAPSLEIAEPGEGIQLSGLWYTGLVIAVAAGATAIALFLFTLGKRLFKGAPFRFRDRLAMVLGIAVLPPFLFLMLMLFRGVTALG